MLLRALTAPDADRPSVLEAALREAGAEAARSVLAGSEHLVVRFRDSAYDTRYRTKLLVAHHDRAAGSPGALDNGAACLQLVGLAGRLARRPDPCNTVLIFTDSEESASAGEQGAFSVARVLAGRVRALSGEGGEPPAVFVFDVTGRGTTPLLSTTARDLLEARGMESSGLSASLRTLGSWAARALRKGTGESPMALPVPWSDDLGFALGGVPAVTVTLLPRAEAEAYRRSLEEKVSDGNGDPAVPGLYPESLPPTWARLHGPGDTADLLEEESFALMERVLDAFAEIRIPRVRRIR